MATVDRVRVLPWRRHAPSAPRPELVPLLNAYRQHWPKGDTDLIVRAYEVADKAHEDVVRQSGEPYISHPLAVALILAEIGLDDITLAAALLHDVVEDTGIELDEISESFGPVVASIVDGVTKLERVSFDSKEAQQAASMRKMLLAIAKDLRVLYIKLGDRLHNMRTIAAMAEFKQKRTAQETLDIYAPLAHRLGIQEVKWQLEDLSFAVLHPKRYAEIEQMVALRAPEREIYIAQVLEVIRERLADHHIQGDVTGRPKHLYSIYEKMVIKGKEFNEIFDLVGIRVMVPSLKDCYAALGAIHATWNPVPGRFKDYIATPKFNLYQSLHTTVVGPQGQQIEVQIRTSEMHARAEFGVAAHYGYKENAAVTASDAAWLQRLVDWQSDANDPAEFFESLKLDLEQDEVFVFTPKGDVVTLPVGSTPVDFAYSVHTEVGHHCIGARINGNLARLDEQLTSGDTVEVTTSKVAKGPSRDWLEFVASPRARNKIRQWFSRERREDALENGRDELSKAIRREGLPVQKLAASAVLVKLAESMHYADLDTLHIAIGEGHVSAKSVAQRLARELRGGDHEEQLPSTVQKPRRRSQAGATGVYVEGLDDLMIRLSRCCTPVPGDDIIGFVTRGRGVSVHRSDCANAAALMAGQEARLIDVEWDRESRGSFIVSVEVKALDRTKLLADVTKVLAEHHVNILSSSTHVGADSVSRMRFEFELADPGHLDSIVASLKRVDSVYDAYRMLPGKGLAEPVKTPAAAGAGAGGADAD
ncbi:MAG TPA: bifunctional (p)ppGpp synthetase/guanosine-3',5'-bis(diphosphate) 3'-pyrophosphohydrolase [Acidimicrobiales bacterium]|nr:bifunctional (p)ppGpp synthetase/guanosine-3',5'-bis(diphosphate) 3'-pyrophosphohydrolase [Acidimicrobiales bacterium]